METELAMCLETVRPHLSAGLIRPYALRLMEHAIPNCLANTANTRLKVYPPFGLHDCSTLVSICDISFPQKQIALCRLFAVCMKACRASNQSVFNLLPFISDCCIREHLHLCFSVLIEQKTHMLVNPSASFDSRQPAKKRRQSSDPTPPHPEGKTHPYRFLHPLFKWADMLELPAITGTASLEGQTAAMTKSVHSLDFILRVFSTTISEDPVTFKQILAKLEKAITEILALCQEVFSILSFAMCAYLSNRLE